MKLVQICTVSYICHVIISLLVINTVNEIWITSKERLVRHEKEAVDQCSSMRINL